MHADFYQIIAQIIPVLLLAISLQSSFVIQKYSYRDSQMLEKGIHSISVAGMCAILILSEAMILTAIYKKIDIELHDLWSIILAIVGSSIYIVTDAVLAIMGKTRGGTVY